METSSQRLRRYSLMDLSYADRRQVMSGVKFPGLPQGELPNDLKGGELERRFLAWLQRQEQEIVDRVDLLIQNRTPRE